jgi:predicted phosphodiesterase
MKIAILADIHANWQALTAVLDFCEKSNISRFWFLGDAVGRGPDPVRVVRWLSESIDAENGNNWVLGNHDAMLADLLTPQEWDLVNDLPKEIISDHRSLIQEEPQINQFVLDNFSTERLAPQFHQLEKVNHVIVHGGLVDNPGYYRYVYPWWIEVLLPDEFKELIDRKDKNSKSTVLWFGHTHIPTLVSALENEVGFEIHPTKIFPGASYDLDPDKLWLVNPGSVGQPRDMDNRASFAVLDTKAHMVTFRRVSYDWQVTADKLWKYQRLRQILRDATPDKDTPQEWIKHFKEAREVEDVC